MSNFLDCLQNDRNLENNLELLQQIALQRYNVHGDECKPFYTMVTSFRIANEFYQRVSGQRKIADLKKQCIVNIVDFINKHPQASSNAIKGEVEKQITIFATRVASL